MGIIRLALALIIFLMLLISAGARGGEEMRVVPAQEILDKIERGEPVEYHHVIVEGDLDLGKLDLPKIKMERTSYEIIKLDLDENANKVSSSIRMNDSEINGSVFLSNSIFMDHVDFRGSFFNGNAYFNFSSFNGTTSFEDSSFNGTADFKHSTFNNDALFGGSTFNKDAFFEYSDFNRNAYFYYSDFNSNAYFYYSDFSDRAFFRNSFFSGIVVFFGSAFKSHADFRGSAFNLSDFSFAEFNKIVYFTEANFNNSARFNDSRFKEDALFEGALFDGPLYLTRTKYDRLYIRWKNIKELGYDDAAYLALLENFKKLGYVEDYDACYYEYRRLHRDQPWCGRYHAMHPWEEWLRKRIDLGLQYFYGYGKKPIWPLLWSAATILLFGLIWRKAGVDGGGRKGGIFERFSSVAAKSQKMSPEEQLRALFGAMLFSATLFLSGTRLFVDPPAMPNLDGWFAAHAHGFFIAERGLGAFFSILFFLAISGTVVR